LLTKGVYLLYSVSEPQHGHRDGQTPYHSLLTEIALYHELLSSKMAPYVLTRDRTVLPGPPSPLSTCGI